jgi:hypothetical protein
MEEPFHRQVQSLANITNTLRKSDESMRDARHVHERGLRVSLFPFDRARRLRRDVVGNPIDTANLIDDPL